MDLDRFWKMIEDADDGHGAQSHAGRLENALKRLTLDEALEFAWIMHVHQAVLRAQEYDVAHKLLTGSISGDGFTDHLYWVISRGREVFAAMLADPDHLAGLEDTGSQEADRWEAEEFGYAADGAVEFLGGDSVRSLVGAWEIDSSQYPEFEQWSKRHGGKGFSMEAVLSPPDPMPPMPRLRGIGEKQS